MFIQRRRRLRYRANRRRFSWLFTLLTGALAGLLVLVVGWIGQMFVPSPPRPVNVDLDAARRAFESGDLDGAVDAAERALSTSPSHPAAVLEMVRALVYRSYVDHDGAPDRRRALELAESALKAHPQSATLLTAQAFALHANGQSFAALSAAESALRLDARNTFARVVLGLSYAGVGAFDRGLSEVQQAARAGDANLDALRAKAVILSDSGRYREAAQSVEEALILNRALIPLHFERALYALQIGDSGAASTAYFRVLALDSGNVKARLRLCELNSTLRERQTALEYCREVVSRAPDWSAGWHALGREYFLEGDFTLAQQALGTCTTLETLQGLPVAERTAECWVLQGQAAQLNGDCATLRETYNEFRVMSASGLLRATWILPPEGPSCDVMP
jgi:tetratricopeptide (TPR) repeat protein